MKTVEDAQKIMDACEEWRKVKPYDDDYSKREIIELDMDGLCGGCCPECTTPTVLRWGWPEINDE